MSTIRTSELSRRRFLQGALAAGSLAAVDLPAIFRADSALAGPPLGADDHILVIVVLEGGNDGLNTAIPYTDGTYYDRRGALAIAADRALPLGEGLGLHPSLVWMHERYALGDVAVVRGIGHPDLDHSHFSGMARIMSGRVGTPGTTGWLGRYLDLRNLDGLAGINIGNGAPPMLLTGEHAGITGLPAHVSGLFGGDRNQRANRYVYESLAGIGDVGAAPWGNVAAKALRDTLSASQMLYPAYAATPADAMPLMRDLGTAAQVINLDVGARVLVVSRGSFDTHRTQLDYHASLLGDLDAGMRTFFDTLKPEFQSRVTVATISEFGRRVEPNGSNGFDHGAASMMFVVGARVRGGLHGAQPSLRDLDARGDLRHSTDVRSVFATLLGTWLETDDQQILGASYPKLDLFKSLPSCAAASVSGVAASAAYHAIAPVRLLDTRTGNGVAKAKLGERGVIDVQITGRGGIPNDAVGAVVLNITATNPTAVSYLTVWPSGEARPDASSVNFRPNSTVPNLVLAKIGAGGRVSIFNYGGDVDVIGDVMGWFPSGNGYRPLTPARILDTRSGLASAARKLGAAQTLRLTVAGRGGVPSTGADSVVLNMTATEPSAISYLTVWPAGSPRPNASNLNLIPNRTAPNLVIAKLSGEGAIDIYNEAGETNVLADVVGWFPANTGYHSLQPSRILDTRTGVGARGRLTATRAIDVDCLCRGGVPINASAVVINVTIAEPDSPGYLSVWPTGERQPNASNLNFEAGQVVPNLAITRLGTDGLVTFYNAFGATHCIADVVGWFE